VHRQVPASEQRPGSALTLHRGPDGSVVRRSVLPGGLRVITEAVPAVRSVSFGLWVGVGSRDETASQAGATHFLEHLLFKGTGRRSALDISSSIDSLGGEINAFTAKEYTCYYARVLDSDLPVAVDVVTDMVTGSLLTRSDVESERGVICEEIAMHDDDAADAVHELVVGSLFGSAPLGRPILGTVESVQGLRAEAIRRYHRRWYSPEHIVVAVAGNVKHARVVRLVQQAFERAGVDLGGATVPAPARIGGARPRYRRSVQLVSRPTEQANVALALPGISRTDPRRFALGVLNAALGGGMSSRLFQEVREKRGLAYSVYSYVSQFSDAGLLGVYAGCLPQKVDDVLELCRAEMLKVAEQGITDTELERGKGQLRGGLVLGLEDTGSRMTRLGKSELVHGELLSVDEILDRIAAVSSDDVHAVAADLLAGQPSLAVVGPFDADREFSAVAG
jgi:predicted Zn-dependent peptidase